MSQPPDEVFISYCWADNTPTRERDEATGKTLAWVEHLERALAARIRLYRGKQTGIWRDASDLRGNFQLEKDVYDALATADFLISVFSKSYIRSDWCPDEFDRFCARVRQQGLEWGRRVFRVFRSALSADELPPGLRDGKCYEFFIRSATGEMTGVVEPNDPQHDALLNGLAKDLALELENRPAAKLGTVYLASPSADLQGRCLGIRTALRDAGYEVLPASPYPATVESFRAAADAELRRCGAILFPVGAEARPPLSDGSDAVALEFALALAACDPIARPMLVWFPASLGEAKAEFLRDFLAGTTARQGSECRRCELPQIKPQCLEWLAAAACAREASLRAVSGGTHVIFDQCDAAHPSLAQFTAFLATRGGAVSQSTFAGTPSELRRMETEALRAARRVVVFSGASSEGWFAAKQAALIANPPPEARSQGFLLANPGNPFHEAMKEALGSAGLLAPFSEASLTGWWEGLP